MRHSSAISVLFRTLFLLCAPIPLLAAQTSDPLSKLSDAEKTYYLKIFDYTMDVVKDNDKYRWASYGGTGSITVGSQFSSKSGTICRNFNETFTVQGVAGADKGIGCKRRGRDGWCKLDLSKAQSCSFEDPPFSFGTTTITTPSVNVGGSAGSADTGNSGGSVSAPTNMGNGSTGDHGVKKGDITAKKYSDTVTSGAGQAAGNAATNGLSWFTNTFR